MLFNNILADFVARFTMAQTNSDIFVCFNYSKILMKILEIFMMQGCMSSFHMKRDMFSANAMVVVYLKYCDNLPLIKRMSLISKPSLRICCTVDNLFIKFNSSAFQGFYLVSTSMGLYTSNELILSKFFLKKVSGEILLKVSF